MSILQLIVRRHAMTPSAARRSQRGCTVPAVLRGAAEPFDSASILGIDALPGQRAEASDPTAITMRRRPVR